MPSLSLDTLPTPCLVLERNRLEANLARMADALSSRGVRLRPHLKTGKCLEVARLAAPYPGTPVAVSTLLEAEYFAANGYRDLFYAVGLAPGKVARAAELHRKGIALKTLVDGVTAAKAIRKGAEKAGVMFSVLLEIDSGERRGGIAPDAPELLAIARELGPHLGGVATHGGHSYGAQTSESLAVVAKAEADAARLAARRLKENGFHAPLVSIGSSPTALAKEDLEGIDEVRAGVYMFWDLMQAGLNACALDDLALSVLTEVIGRQPGRNEFLIDAGALALSKDRMTASLPPPLQAEFGWVCDLDGRLLPGLKVLKTWQEHGLVVSETELPKDAFPVGTRLRILPNHACLTAAAYDRYHVVSGNRGCEAVWKRINGW